MLLCMQETLVLPQGSISVLSGGTMGDIYFHGRPSVLMALIPQRRKSVLTRAPVAVSANFAIGGGICYHPLLTKKPIGLERPGKKHSIALNRYFQKYLVIFLLRAILGSPEVIKGQSLIDVILFRKCAVMSGTAIARRTQMIPIDSFCTLLLIRSIKSDLRSTVKPPEVKYVSSK